jgi:diguanylate cyclase (GGDEF)-like protein
MDEGQASPVQPGRRRRVTRLVTLALWGAVIAFAVVALATNPTLMTGILTGAFVLLFGAVHAQWLLSNWARTRGWRRFSARMTGSGYISELYGLPNRNYLLAEIRREISASRTQETTFTMLHFSFETLDGIRERRGHEFGERAIAAMVKLLRRITRDSDFISYIGDGQFVILLNECTGPQSMTYLRRVPGTIAVSNGKRMFEVPVTARMSEYDMESIYGTDVLAEVENAPPLARKEAPGVNSQAA